MSKASNKYPNNVLSLLWGQPDRVKDPLLHISPVDSEAATCKGHHAG